MLRSTLKYIFFASLLITLGSLPVGANWVGTGATEISWMEVNDQNYILITTTSGTDTYFFINLNDFTPEIRKIWTAQLLTSQSNPDVKINIFYNDDCNVAGTCYTSGSYTYKKVFRITTSK